jgi:transposase
MLVEAAWVASKTPGPLRAFYERVRARRGTQIAVVATARKLTVLCWHLVVREQDYAFARPPLRSFGPWSFAPAWLGRRGHKGKASGYSLKKTRARERELSEQAERPSTRPIDGKGGSLFRSSRKVVGNPLI